MPYNLSFTSGGLLFEESNAYINSIIDVEACLRGDERPDYNVLPVNSEKSRKRIKVELDKRLRNLDKEHIAFLQEANENDQRILLFLAICKTYDIITEFCIEVVYKKWQSFNLELSTYDFKYFLSSKLPEERFDSLTSNTVDKLAQVALKMLRDVGIVENKRIKGVRPSVKLTQLIKRKKDDWFFNCILATQN